MRTFTKRDNLVIALISIIIGIVGLSMYYSYFGTGDVQTSTTPVSTNTNVRGNTGPDYTPNQKATSTDKTYINSTEGFTVKYPANSLGLNINSIFNSIDVSANGLAYNECSTQLIAANGTKFCPIRVVDHGAGMVAVDNSYIAEHNGMYYTVKLSGQFKSAGTCAGIANCTDYGMIQNLFEQKILPSFTFLK